MGSDKSIQINSREGYRCDQVDSSGLLVVVCEDYGVTQYSDPAKYLESSTSVK